MLDNHNAKVRRLLTHEILEVNEIQIEERKMQLEDKWRRKLAGGENRH